MKKNSHNIKTMLWYERCVMCIEKDTGQKREFFKWLAITKIKTDGTKESLFDLDIIDFKNNNVICIPQNKICELRIRADNTIENAKLTIYPQYKCV